MESDDTEKEQEKTGGGLQLDVLKSYLTFAARAVRKRLYLSVPIFVIGTALTILAVRFLPRTFQCSTVMMGESNQVFGDWQPQPFAGVNNLVMRRENLEALVRDTGLVKKSEARRPPLLKMKDDLAQSIFGKWDSDLKAVILVGTLESRLGVSTDGPTMTVSVQWTDGETAAEIAEAARESFLKTRRATDLAAFHEKMAILDGHATKLRSEIEQLASQIAKEQETGSRSNRDPLPATSAAPRALPPRVGVRRAESQADPGQPERKEKLEAMRRRLADLDGERDRRVREERAKLADLRLRLAPSHPEVLTAEQRLAMLAQEPSEVALLRTEIKSFEQEIAQRDALSVLQGKGSRFLGAPAAPVAEPLPTSITELLNENDADPALLAQLSGAVAKYGALRDQVRSGRIDIDTAQAAFNQRYRIIVPAEAPSRPIKPNILTVFGGGLAVALLLALLLPILAELRTGVIRARWQVHLMHLPVLAELRLPPSSGS
jgi:uncharacterized protein involved in exopolysaccharide biosynthesis